MISQVGFYRSPLGFMRIESEDEAITTVSFLDEEMVPPADTVSTVVLECMHQLDAYFAGKLVQFTVPLKLHGTDFQLKVWDALMVVDFANTMSYHKLSAIIGNTKAIRAVAMANGKNPVAILIPCHRIIGSDGSLTGYAGKLWRKQWLLEHETSVISKQLKMEFN